MEFITFLDNPDKYTTWENRATDESIKSRLTLFIANGIDISYVDIRGQSVLIHLCNSGELRRKNMLSTILDLLITKYKSKIIPNHKDMFGRTAFDYALKNDIQNTPIDLSTFRMLINYFKEYYNKDDKFQHLYYILQIAGPRTSSSNTNNQDYNVSIYQSSVAFLLQMFNKRPKITLYNRDLKKDVSIIDFVRYYKFEIIYNYLLKMPQHTQDKQYDIKTLKECNARLKSCMDEIKRSDVKIDWTMLTNEYNKMRDTLDIFNTLIKSNKK